jgi:hypothetical protein
LALAAFAGKNRLKHASKPPRAADYGTKVIDTLKQAPWRKSAINSTYFELVLDEITPISLH